MLTSSLDGHLRLPRQRYFSALEWHAVAIGTIAAIVLIVGYGFNVDIVQRLGPGLPTMKFITATAWMALSLSCLMSLRETQQAKWISVGIAGALIVWLLYARVAFADALPDNPVTILPSWATWLSLLAGAVALLVINLAPRAAIVAALLAMAAAVPAIYRVFSLLLFQGAPDADSPLNTMALHTAALIVWFMLVCVMLHPALGIGRVLLQSSLRGRLLRRALPALVVVPVAAAALSLALREMQGWSVEGLFGLNAVIGVALGTLLIWWLSRLVGDWQAEAAERAEQLTRANEALERYASSAAHDLKAPARHVLLYGELLAEALERGDIDGARKQAAAIRRSAQEMPKLIDGMLAFSKSAYTRVSISQSALSEIVQAAALQQADNLQAAKGQITLVNDPVIACDRTLVTALFQNLFTNSINNRRPDRALAIRVDCVRDGDFWRLSVEDNGPGFDPRFAPVAFNPLARGASAGAEGAGIGLAACRTIVQSHGGQVRIDPDFKSGARIEFTLPVKAAPQA